MRRAHLIVVALLCFVSIPGFAVTITPGPAVFGNLMTIDDYLTRVYDTGQLTYSQPSLLQQTCTTTGGGGTVNVDSRSSVAATGAPFVRAQVDTDYLGSYGVTGRSSASMSYQVVITGGTSGALTPVNFGTFGELTNSSTCSTCPASGWWSASALLRIVDPATGTEYFQLDGTSDTLYQSGAGSTPIAIFTTLDLPIDVPLDVILGVTAYAYTQEKWLNQLIGPVTSLAYLDPVFEPLEAGISVLQSGNLVAPSGVPLPASLDLLIAGLLALAVPGHAEDTATAAGPPVTGAATSFPFMYAWPGPGMRRVATTAAPVGTYRIGMHQSTICTVFLSLYSGPGVENNVAQRTGTPLRTVIKPVTWRLLAGMLVDRQTIFKQYDS